MYQLKPFKNVLFALNFIKVFSVLGILIFQILNVGYLTDVQTKIEC